MAGERVAVRAEQPPNHASTVIKARQTKIGGGCTEPHKTSHPGSHLPVLLEIVLWCKSVAGVSGVPLRFGVESCEADGVFDMPIE